MVINTLTSNVRADIVLADTVPIDTVRLNTVPADDAAAFGPGAAAHERRWTSLGVEGSQWAGVSAVAKHSCGYLRETLPPRFVDAARLGKSGATSGPAGTFPASTIQISTSQISYDQRNTDQMARLIPLTGGGVGSHPAREPGSA